MQAMRALLKSARNGPLKTGFLLMTALVFAGPAAARQQPAAPDVARSQALDTIVACRTITVPADRLACFDRNVDALQVATEKRDIVVVNREDVRKARRSLFGFNIPEVPILGGSGGKPGAVAEEDREISSTVRAAQQDRDGNWIITLDDGAVWHQTNGGPLAMRPKPGTNVTIRRAALGSYFMQIGKQPGVRARRES